MRWLVILLLASPAYGQIVCGPRFEIIEQITGTFGQVVQVDGLQSNGSILEIYANPETGKWTAVTTNARGLSCVQTAGHGFMASRALRGQAL